MFPGNYSAPRRSRGITGRSSVKRVFNNAHLAHVWAQQTQDEGRTTNGNFYFRGDTIYSYGEHFPIARFTGAALRGERVVLFNSATYSVSTSGHQADVRRALHGLPVAVLYVKHPEAEEAREHALNVAELVKSFQAKARDCANMRKTIFWDRQDTADVRVAALNASVSAIEDYCNAFGLDVPSLEIDVWERRIRDAFTAYNSPAKVAKRARDKEKRKTRWAGVMARAMAHLEGVAPGLSFDTLNQIPKDERLRAGLPVYGYGFWDAHKVDAKAVRLTPDEWRNGKGPASAHHMFADGYYYSTLLRRKGSRLETSRGAEVPFAQAVIAFHRAARCRRTGTEWRRNGEQIPVGHFQVDSIDAQGNMRAGCHTLSWDEMLRLAVREIPEQVRPTFPVPALIAP